MSPRARALAGLLLALVAACLATNQAASIQARRSLRQHAATDAQFGRHLQGLPFSLPSFSVCSLFTLVLRAQGGLDAVAGRLLTNAWSEATDPISGFIHDPISLRNIKIPIPSSNELPAQGNITLRSLGGLHTLRSPSVRVYNSSCADKTLAAQAALSVSAGKLSLNASAKVRIVSPGILLPEIDLNATITISNATLRIGSHLGATLDSSILKACGKILNITSVDLTYTGLSVTLSLPRNLQALSQVLEQTITGLIRTATTTLTVAVKNQLNTGLHRLTTQQCSHLISALSG